MPTHVLLDSIPSVIFIGPVTQAFFSFQVVYSVQDPFLPVQPCLVQASFIFLNWLAPSTMKSTMQTAQTNFTSNVILGSEDNFGAVLMPIFTYKKGQLWVLETANLRSLAMTGLNVDSAWHLCFQKKAGPRVENLIFAFSLKVDCSRTLECHVHFCIFFRAFCPLISQADSRDGRPCTFPGRFLFHPQAKDKHIWSKCALVRNVRTGEADMLHARDMVQIEDVSADALPSTVDDDNAVVQGAQKYQQATGTIQIPGHHKIFIFLKFRA
jgi:hypothetical protein